MNLRLSVLLVLAITTPALGTTISTVPRPAYLLASGKFIAQDSPKSVCVYDSNGTTAARFTSAGVTTIASSADEKYLLIGCDDGSVTASDLKTGCSLWSRSRAETLLRYIYDVSFSQDGRFCVICGASDRAIVFDSATGRQAAVVNFPPKTTSTMSAALSPDGSTGVLIALNDRVFTFDVPSGTKHETALTGAWPIRYSSDGRYFVFRSSNSGSYEHVRIASASTLWCRDIGDFAQIGNIRPDDNGTFRVTALGPYGPQPQIMLGLRFDPDAQELKKLWDAPCKSVVERRTDFDPTTMIGVSTNYKLITSVIDLRNNTIRKTIDNSANFRPIVVTWSTRPAPQSDLSGLTVKILTPILGLLLLTIAWRRRTAKARS